MEGFQLWLNLPARDKMSAPWYRDIQGDAIPAFTTAAGVLVRAIAGTSHGVAGAMQRPVTHPLYLDLHFDADARFEQAIAPGHNAFLYVYRGEVNIGADRVPVRRMAILANDRQADGVVLQASAGTRAILIAGQPLGEPIAQHGPFVMNTQQEIYQTIEDFRQGRFGAPTA